MASKRIKVLITEETRYWIRRSLSLFFKLQLCNSVFLPLLSQVQELSYGFWYNLISFSPLVFFFVRLCYFLSSWFFWFFSPSGEKIRVTFFVFKVCFFCWHQITESIKYGICFSLPHQHSPHCPHTSVPHWTTNACSRCPSLPPHNWPWHKTVFIHEPFPPLLLSILLLALQLELPSGSVCSLMMWHNCFLPM